MKENEQRIVGTLESTPPCVFDLLPVTPSQVPFAKKVEELCLSTALLKKILLQNEKIELASSKGGACSLTVHDEKELATEVLLYRHRFTEKVFATRTFRQAALSIIQNIYLFRNRKIFFGTSSNTSSATERQEALLLFGDRSCKGPLPLAKTFQHLILAKVWKRIVSQNTEQDRIGEDFIEIHEIVQKLNTIRNIYILLSAGLVKRLACRISDIYKESITQEDAVQIGSFGIARAAYRYHQSCGVRFSTYAANWFYKEIQSQALKGRLIRISANTVEGYARAAREKNSESSSHFSTLIENATTVHQEKEDNYSNCVPLQLHTSLPEQTLETRQIQRLLHNAIDQVLPGKSGDIIKRRYGLFPYNGREQSIIAISKGYGVTRSSIYQLEQTALKKLSKHLQKELA